LLNGREGRGKGGANLDLFAGKAVTSETPEAHGAAVLTRRDRGKEQGKSESSRDEKATGRTKKRGGSWSQRSAITRWSEKREGPTCPAICREDRKKTNRRVSQSGETFQGRRRE